MSLINSKIKQIHRSAKSEYEFKKIDLSADSYYMDYSVSSHIDFPLIDYDSENIKILRNKLQKLWENDVKVQKYIPIVMMALTHELIDEGELPKIDLYNYMM